MSHWWACVVRCSRETNACTCEQRHTRAGISKSPSTPPTANRALQVREVRQMLLCFRALRCLAARPPRCRRRLRWQGRRRCAARGPSVVHSNIFPARGARTPLTLRGPGVLGCAPVAPLVSSGVLQSRLWSLTPPRGRTLMCATCSRPPPRPDHSCLCAARVTQDLLDDPTLVPAFARLLADGVKVRLSVCLCVCVRVCARARVCVCAYVC